MPTGINGLSPIHIMVDFVGLSYAWPLQKILINCWCMMNICTELGRMELSYEVIVLCNPTFLQCSICVRHRNRVNKLNRWLYWTRVWIYTFQNIEHVFVFIHFRLTLCFASTFFNNLYDALEHAWYTEHTWCTGTLYRTCTGRCMI